MACALLSSGCDLSVGFGELFGQRLASEALWDNVWGLRLNGGQGGHEGKDALLYLDGNNVWDKIASGVSNGCLVVAFGGWRRQGKHFFYAVHLGLVACLLCWCSAAVAKAVTEEEKSIRCNQTTTKKASFFLYYMQKFFLWRMIYKR